MVELGLPSSDDRAMSQAVGEKTKVDARNLDRILHIQVPIIVRLAEKDLPLREVLNLSIGSIIEFDKNAEDLLDLMVNNQTIGRGEAVKIGEKFGLKVTDIGPVQERIETLRGQ
jgi:flagellar motor switch protein FliN/FliY